MVSNRNDAPLVKPTRTTWGRPSAGPGATAAPLISSVDSGALVFTACRPVRRAAV
jgi:hypothetical protein